MSNSVFNYKFRYIVLTVMIVVLVALYVGLNRQSITTKFISEESLIGWKFLYNPKVTSYSRTSDGMSIKTHSETYIVSPKQDDGMIWPDWPYVVIKIAPASKSRVISLIWFFKGADAEEFYSRPVTVKPGQSEIVFNSQDVKLNKRIDSWDDEYPDGGKIIQYGFRVYNDVTFKSVTLTNSWPLYAILHEVFYDIFTRKNPFHSYSINLEKGPVIIRFWFNTLLGFIVVIGTLYYLIEKRTSILLVTLSLSLVIFDTNLLLNLTRFAKYSSTISAFHKNEFDEFTSRFGSEFAEFNSMLRRIIPNQSHVLFVNSSKGNLVRGESNWIEKLYAGIYIYNSDRYDYIALFYPMDLTTPPYAVDGKHFLDIGSKTYQIELAEKLSDRSMILKVIHD